MAYSLENFGKVKNEKNRLCIQIAGDDEEQKKIVKKLISDWGFDPYDNGNLEILGVNNRILRGIAAIILAKN